MNATLMSIAIARHFDTRLNIIVPNVSWGIGLHECDVLVITKAGYAIEVEIKTSKADIKADLKKRHSHENKKLRSLIFAIPKNLEHCSDLIPERAGIITIERLETQRPTRDNVIGPNPSRLYCSILRKAKINTHASKLSDTDILHVAKLGVMRMWNMKEKLMRL